MEHPFIYGVDVEEIKGIKVLADNGDEIGTVSEIYLNPLTLLVEGIKVGKGLFRTDIFIGRDYIRQMTSDSVMLNMTPTDTIKGMKVFDADGKELGKVKEVNRDEPANDLVSIVVDRGSGEDLVFDFTDIRVIGKNVMLNVPVEG